MRLRAIDGAKKDEPIKPTLLLGHVAWRGKVAR
jgi:hypothetical protein